MAQKDINKLMIKISDEGALNNLLELSIEKLVGETLPTFDSATVVTYYNVTLFSSHWLQPILVRTVWGNATDVSANFQRGWQRRR